MQCYYKASVASHSCTFGNTMEQMIDEPTSNRTEIEWEEMLLGDAFEFEYGKALKKENRNGEGSYAVMGSNGIVGYHNEYLIKGPGIVVGRKGAAGEVTYIESDFWPIDTTYYVKPKKNVSLKYGYYLLKSLRLNQFEKSTAIPGLNRNDAYAKAILLPPIEQQNAIVSKIEELFSELDKSIEELKTAQQQLKVYRQAVLKWAFEGKLTNENVKEGELPEGWSLIKLKDAANKITDGEHFKPQTQEVGVPFLSAKDVRDNGVSFEETLFISEETAKKALQRCNPQRGDILIVSRGATVGRMCIVRTDKVFCLLGSVILIKAKDELSSDFLTYILKSPQINRKLISISGATAQQAIYLRDIKEVQLPLPPIEEQHQIVQEIESRLSVCDKIEETITDSLKQAEALRQSILKETFEGKLLSKKQ